MKLVLWIFGILITSFTVFCGMVIFANACILADEGVSERYGCIDD